jgi:hypothetical protein
LSKDVDYAGLPRPSSGKFALGAYEPQGLAPADTPKNVIVLTASSNRSSIIDFSIDSLPKYDPRVIDTVGIWCVSIDSAGSHPSPSTFNLASPTKKFNFFNMISAGPKYSDTLLNPASVPGTFYWLLASVRNGQGHWAAIDTSRAKMVKMYKDNIAVDPSSMTFFADSFPTQYTLLQLSWRNGDSLKNNSDADSIGIWRRSDQFPIRANDTGAVKVGI